MYNKILGPSRYFFLGIVAAYAIIAIVYILNLSGSIGDEIVFLRDLKNIQEFGWIETIKLNISIPYMLLVHPLSFLFDNLIALRLTNWIVTVCLIVYFVRQKKSKWFYGYLLFYLCTTLFFLRGTNDAIFSTALIIFINEVYMFQRKERQNLTMALIMLTIAFFTRTLFVVFLPVIIYGLYIAFTFRKTLKVKWIYPIIVFMILVTMNIPSILHNNALSYDRKSPPKDVNATWVQKQYLAQLMVNNDEIANFSHPSWKQTVNYLQEHGEDALPDSTFEALFFDIKLTIKEFFKDFYFTSFFGFRQIGLILIITIFTLFKYIYDFNKIDSNMYIPLSLLCTMCVFSLIIISYIEARWFAPVFIMALVYYSDLEREIKIPKTWILANYAVFIFFTLYGGFRLFNKI